MELSESFLDISGCPLRNEQLRYKPQKSSILGPHFIPSETDEPSQKSQLSDNWQKKINNYINKSDSKDYGELFFKKNQSETSSKKTEKLDVAKKLFKAPLSITSSQKPPKYAQSSQEEQVKERINKIRENHHEDDHLQGLNDSNLPLTTYWKSKSTNQRNSFKLDLVEAQLIDRGDSDDELETNKTVKLINQRIKDFESEFKATNVRK